MSLFAPLTMALATTGTVMSIADQVAYAIRNDDADFLDDTLTDDVYIGPRLIRLAFDRGSRATRSVVQRHALVQSMTAPVRVV